MPFPNYLHAHHPLLLFKNNVIFLNSDIPEIHKMFLFNVPQSCTNFVTIQSATAQVRYISFLLATQYKKIKAEINDFFNWLFSSYSKLKTIVMNKTFTTQKKHRKGTLIQPVQLLRITFIALESSFHLQVYKKRGTCYRTQRILKPKVYIVLSYIS